ncbi:MAG: ribose 5-phosphate isomerase B [Eubacteriales bacterium]|nr:ribose 5-phosphate isomerase B [Eubacteriales bacterium]
MNIAIGNDHAGVIYKKELIKYLEEKGHKLFDVGTDSEESCNYPIYAKKVCEKIINKECTFGILICGTGIGMSISANKVKGIRAACLQEEKSAKLSREHNDANIICMGSRIISIEKAKEIVDGFLNATFQGGRHKERIDLIE